MNLQTILDTYTKENVALQKRCKSCDGCSEDCDECKVLRHKPIRELLEGAGIQLRKYEDDNEDDFGFRNSFLTGSCARKTAIRPPKDVDFFVVIDADHYAGAGGRPGARELLQKLEKVIQQTLGKEVFGHTITGVDAQRRSVNIMFDDKVGVDIIPAFHADESTDAYELFEIPDEELGYIKSNPKKHAEMLRNAVNENRLSELRNIIKLIRKWRKVSFQEDEEKPKPFHLEMVAIKLFSEQFPEGIPDALCLYFEKLPSAFIEASMPDSAYPSSEQPRECWIDAYVDELSPQGKEEIIKRINSTHLALSEARVYENDQKLVRAVKKIREVFPDLPQQELERTFEAVKDRTLQSQHEYAGTRTSSGPWRG